MTFGTWSHKGRSYLKARPQVFLILFCVVIFSVSVFRVPSFQEIRASHRPSDIKIVDRNGHTLDYVRREKRWRSLEWTAWQEVSPAFKELLIRAEDKRFYQHPGVDPLALANSFLSYLRGQKRGGGSTLTMQVARLLGKEHESKMLFFKKPRQIFDALMLELRWSKEEILEAYINLVPYRGELVGLKAASLGFFSKEPHGLTDDEAAILVALLRGPNAELAVIARRICMLRTSCEDARILAQKVLAVPYRLPRARDILPVVATHIVKTSKQSVTTTTLDLVIQRQAMDALREQLRTLVDQNVNDGAVLVLDTKTGEPLAYIANGGKGFSSANQNDGVQMVRQVGSTIKPFVFATAFDLNLLTPNSLLDDAPLELSLGEGRVYQPKNYDHIFRGLVTVKDALGSSINVPAVKALKIVGENEVLKRLKALGIKNLQSEEYYGASLGLGTVDLSLWELTHAYRQLAVEGNIFSNATRSEVTQILSQPENRRFTFGMDSILTLPFTAAVKTGTSKDMRDNWCMGYTSEYTVGVWVGNFNGEPMWNVSGISGAAPVWNAVMLALHGSPPSAQIAAKFESTSEPLPERTISRIRYPVDQTLIGYDPDMPRSVQQLPIEIENPQSGDQVFLNSKILGTASKRLDWPISLGRYVVELKTARGDMIDRVQFDVR